MTTHSPMDRPRLRCVLRYSYDIIAIAVAAAALCFWQLSPQQYIEHVRTSTDSLLYFHEGVDSFNMARTFASALLVGVLVASITTHNILWLAALPALIAGCVLMAFAAGILPGLSYYSDWEPIILFLTYGSGGIVGAFVVSRINKESDTHRKETYRLLAMLMGIGITIAAGCHHLGFIRGTVKEASTATVYNVRLLRIVYQAIEENRNDEAKHLLRMQLSAYEEGVQAWSSSPFMTDDQLNTIRKEIRHYKRGKRRGHPNRTTGTPE